MASDFVTESVTLRDGTPITLRAIRPDDAPRLQALHSRLSPGSIFLRFLDQRRALSDQEARRFATVDYHTHMAIVAATAENGEAPIVGVARYATDSARPDIAEAAVVVEDGFQGRGLGTILVNRIVLYAQAHGIRTFLATVHYSNTEIMRFIEHSGLPAEKRLEAGVWEIRIRLDASPPTPLA